MDHKQFQDWLSGIDHLSPAQRQEAETVFMGVSEASSSLAAIEASVGESRQCPHCGTPGAISRGKARGLRRYQCKGCNKTFNGALRAFTRKAQGGELNLTRAIIGIWERERQGKQPKGGVWDGRVQ